MAAIANDWVRPQLVVLSRGRAEESVLQTCKNKDPQLGPIINHANCHNANNCSTCDALSAS
jgi:hypothetical protein